MSLQRNPSRSSTSKGWKLGNPDAEDNITINSEVTGVINNEVKGRNRSPVLKVDYLKIKAFCLKMHHIWVLKDMGKNGLGNAASILGARNAKKAPRKSEG